MTVTDPIGDMLARIRNAQQRAHKTVLIPNSKFKRFILDAMVREGFLISYEITKDQNTKFDFLKVNLKYVQGNPVIREMMMTGNYRIRYRGCSKPQYGYVRSQYNTLAEYADTFAIYPK